MPAPDYASSRTYVLEKVFDFAATPLTAAASPHLCFDVPAGSYIQNVRTKVETEEGGTLTFDVGDVGDADGWAAGVDGDVAGNAIDATAAYAVDVLAAPFGHQYDSAGVVNLTLNNDADAAKIVIQAVVTVFDL